jgi:hypothetical protein
VKRKGWGGGGALRCKWISMAAAAVADGSLRSRFLDREPHRCTRFWIGGTRVVGYGPEASWSAGPRLGARHLVVWSGTGCH